MGLHKGYTPSEKQKQTVLRNQFSKMDPEKHREISRKGGLATQEKWRKRRGLKEACLWLLEQDMFENGNELLAKLKERYPDLSNGEAMAASLIGNVLNTGDAKAFNSIRDTSGEVPTANVNISNNEPMTITVKTVD